MKKFINKNLAVILSFAIVLCTLLPVMSGVVGAVSYDDAAVAELKEAWNALSVKKTAHPDTLWNGNNVVVPNGLTLIDGASYTGTDLTDKSVLGDKYVSYDSTGTSAGDQKDYIVFSFDNNTYTIGDLKNFSVYAKNSASINIRPFFHIPTGTRGHNASYFAGTEIGINTWKELKMSDLPDQSGLWANASDGIGGLKDRILTGVGFDIGGVGNVTLGSMTFEFAAANADILALADTNAGAFVEAAMAFRTEAIDSGYYADGDVAFNAFLLALNKVLDDTAQRDALADAWADLTIETYFIPDKVWSSQNTETTGLVLSDTSAYADGDLTDTSVLGHKFATYTSVNDAGASDFANYILFSNQLVGSSLTIDKLSGYSVYVKAPGFAAARPKLHFENGAVKWWNANFYKAEQFGGGSWTEIKMSDLPEQDKLWSDGPAVDVVKTSAISAIGLDLSGTGSVTLGSLKATFAAVSDDTLALKNTNEEAFKRAAKAFYAEAVANNYFAEDDAKFQLFKETLSDYIGDVEQQAKINALKDAWSELSDITREFVPDIVWDGKDTPTVGLVIKDTSEYDGGDLTDTSVLGSKYATYTVKANGASEWKDFVIFSSVGEDNSLNIQNIKGYTFYIKSSAATLARPKAILANAQQLWNNPSLHNESAIGTNEWKQINSADMNEQSKLWTDNGGRDLPNDAPLTGFGLDFSQLNGATTNITIGSMKVVFTAVNSDTLALASSNGDEFIAKAEAFYEEAIANEYYAEDDVKFAAFAQALTAAQGPVTIEKIAFKLADAWKQLKIYETFVPAVVWSGNNVVGTGLNVYDSSAYEGSDIDKSLLGPKYATYNAYFDDGGASDASDYENYVLFQRADGTPTATNIGNLESFSVYMKSATGMPTRPKLHLQTATVWNNPSFFNATLLTSQWSHLGTHNISDLYGFQNCYAANSHQGLVSIGFDFAGAGDIVVGSMELVFNAVDSKTLGLLNTDITSFVTEALYFYDNAVANSSFSEDNVIFAEFAKCIEQIRNIQGADEVLAIAELRAAWKTLSSITLPTADTSKWTVADWVYAANRLDISGYANTEKFKEALAVATALRDELGMSVGCNFTSYPTFADSEDVLSTLGENVLLGKMAEAYYYNGVELGALVTPTTEALSDGSYDTVFSASDLDFSAEGSYVEFVYGFEGAAEVKDFVVGLSNNADLAKLNYRIYAANNRDELSLTSSIVASCDNTNGEQIQLFNYDDKPDIVAAYIAFRFYGGANGLNVNELSVYGKVSTYSVTTGSFSDDEMAALGNNLLANSGVIAYLKTGNSVKTKWDLAGLGYPVGNIVDGNSKTVVGFGQLANMAVFNPGEEISLHILFDLRESYYLEKILMNLYHEKYLEAGLYEIYASTELVTLYKKENKILEYNNMVDSENGTTKTQLFTARGEGKVARYVDFHIRVPISDYEKGLEKYGYLCYPRLRDLGVYGSRYNKPYAEINFLPHVPVELYRTDAGGNKVSISEEEYGHEEYAYAFDGKYDVATPIAQNGKNIDFIFNLCADKIIKSVKLSTLTENIKGVKIYASNNLEDIWNESSVVLDYSGDAVKEVYRAFAETPINARYVRFSINDTVSGILDPTEIEVIGGNTQEFIYMNLVEERSDSVSLWLEEKKDDYYLSSTHESANEYNSAWNAENIYGMSYAFDGEEGTVADFYGGSLGNADGTGRETYSFLMDLGNLMAIDSINFIAGSSSDYWPTKVNFYFGEDDIALFGKDAVPAIKFTEKSSSENGSYSYEFLPEIAQYVRIEVVESSHRYYDMHNFIATVVAEIQVHGLEIIGMTASEGVAASVTHMDTGIRADIVALRDNDVFTTVQDIEVISRPANDDEKKALAEQDAIFASDIYDIYILDANQKFVTDVDGRDIKIYIPKALFKGSGDAYVLLRQYGEYVMVDFVTEDDYYVVTVDDPSDMSVAFCEFADIEIPEEPTDMGNDLTDDEDDCEDEPVEEDEDEDEDDDKPKKKKKIKVIRNNNDGDFDYLWLIIGGAIAVVLIAAGITLFLILKKKKDREEEQ